LQDERPTPASDYVVNLDGGELCAQVVHRDPTVQGYFVIRAPDLRAVAIGTRFCVHASSSLDGSWVDVEEGRVRVDRMGHGSVMAGPGTTVRAGDSDASVPSNPAPTVHSSSALPAKTRRDRATSRCLMAESPAGRESCLWLEAGGSDLTAQNALYTLGTLAQRQEHDGKTALSIWQTYLHRFPQGALTAETTWAIFDELVNEHRYEEALLTSDEFLRAFPEYSGAGEFELRRGRLLADSLGRPHDAEKAYQRILGGGMQPLLRQEALFQLGLCQERLGEVEAARATWRRYEEEFPTGQHLADAARHRDAL
jgi:TolA-binding protein